MTVTFGRRAGWLGLLTAGMLTAAAFGCRAQAQDYAGLDGLCQSVEMDLQEDLAGWTYRGLPAFATHLRELGRPLVFIDEEELRQKKIDAVLDVARSQVGTVGGIAYEDCLMAEGGQLCIGRGYWCGTFLWWCFHEAGQSQVYCDGNMTVHPVSVAEYYQETGRFDDTPHPGDLVFFYWTPLPDVEVEISHVAIVESVTEEQITTVEGNISNQVQAFTWERDCEALRGYAHPDY